MNASITYWQALSLCGQSVSGGSGSVVTVPRPRQTRQPSRAEAVPFTAEPGICTRHLLKNQTVTAIMGRRRPSGVGVVAVWVSDTGGEG